MSYPEAIVLRCLLNLALYPLEIIPWLTRKALGDLDDKIPPHLRAAYGLDGVEDVVA